MTKQETEKPNSINDIDTNELSSFIKSVMGDNSDDKNVSPKDLETAKIILGIILHEKNIGSTTNLSALQIDDISNAEMINEIVDNPLIVVKINSFRIHRRSLIQKDNNKNLLQILSDIVSTSTKQTSDFLSSIGDRFK